MNRTALLPALLLPFLLRADGPTADLGRRVLEAGLDFEECYQVRDLRFSKEDLRIYLTEGHLIFGKAVDGVRFSAVFLDDIEGGDAEMLLLPPTRSERRALAAYAETPNLDEHFSTGAFLFTDDTYQELMKQIRAQGAPRRDVERGRQIAQEWDPIVRNFTSSFQIRVVSDLLSENRAPRGLFYAAVHGLKLGNLDVSYDPLAREQIALGQVTFRQEQAFFDIWTRFPARSSRKQNRPMPAPDLRITSYRINAALEPNLHLRVETTATVTPSPESRRALSFDISSQMRVTAARIDGEPAEVYQPVSLRAGLIRGDLNQSFLLRPAKPLEPGREYEVVFEHDGDVIADAGNKVYFVGARGSWYPNRFTEFARYDLTFRYPKDLDLVATGKPVEDKTEGDWRITRRRTETPVRMAGFNLGNYERQSVTRGGYTIEVYANRTIETALERRRPPAIVPPPAPGPPGNRRWTVDLDPFPLDSYRPDPAARLEQLALEIAGSMEFLSAHFGPPILKWLTIAPIPGTFGQGFPGLIYLSTLAYLDSKDRPATVRNSSQELFYSEILHAHETAHQWWGNVVTSASYEDDWIMEALANYSALLYLEKRKGGRALDTVLEDYKGHLLAKAPGADTVESAGPIVWGPRLHSSQTPNGWRIITYEKGSWIIHMLRRRIGDERFLAALANLRQRYQQQAITTEQFRQAMADGLPPQSPDPTFEAFFDQWVYATGVPALKLNYTVRGAAPAVRVTGTVVQSGVDSEFSTLVPIEVQVAKAKPIVTWVRTASEPVSFTVNLKQAPTKVTLDPGNSVLRR